MHPKFAVMRSHLIDLQNLVDMFQLEWTDVDVVWVGVGGGEVAFSHVIDHARGAQVVKRFLEQNMMEHLLTQTKLR